MAASQVAGQTSEVPAKATRTATRSAHTAHKLPVNVDFLAISIALALAALIRFGVIHQVKF